MSRFIRENGEDREMNSFSASRVFNDPLAAIYNQGQWRISRLSALFNLLYNTVKLKQYGSKIKHALASTVATNASIKYSVTVEVNPSLKYSEDDADAIMITVFINQSESANKPKIVYEAILLSWGVSNEVTGAKHLPYLLERGEQKVGTTVKNSLGTMFDCKIQQFSFTQHHLLQFAFSFLETETSNFDKHVGFSFSTPQADVKDKLTINFEIGDVYKIWNVVKEETTRRADQVKMTYQMLQNQIFHMFTLDISVLDLCEINLPQASAKSNGSIKMKTPEMVNCVFTLLNEIANVDII